MSVLRQELAKTVTRYFVEEIIFFGISGLHLGRAIHQESGSPIEPTHQ
jgi:hypothetical protein